MRKETGSTFLGAMMVCTCLLQCISIPSAPPSAAPECTARFFTIRRQVKEVQEKNYAHQTAMGFIGGMGLWLPALLLVPMVGGTSMQLKHKGEADALVKEWHEQHCQKAQVIDEREDSGKHQL